MYTKNFISFFILVLVLINGCIALNDEKQTDSAKQSPSLNYYAGPVSGTAETITCDVAVYGGSPAGVSASIQAARMGKDVVFMVFNKHVGGLTSGD